MVCLENELRWLILDSVLKHCVLDSSFDYEDFLCQMSIHRHVHCWKVYLITLCLSFLICKLAVIMLAQT